HRDHLSLHSFPTRRSSDLDISSIWKSKLTMSGVSVTNGKIFIKKQVDSTTNFSFIQEYFSSDKPKDEKTKKFDFVLPDARLKNIDRKSTRLNSSHVKISYA